MRKFLISSAVVAATAFTVMPLTTSSSFSQDVELRLDRNGPNLRLRDDCDPDYEDCGRERRGGSEARREERGCSPDRALRKAERMGVRRARVVDVGRRTIDVSGRDRRGDRVVMSFGRRDRSCPVY